MRRFFLSLLLLVLLGTGVFFAEQWNFFAPGPAAHGGNRATIVWITPRQSSAAIASQLQAAGVVRDARLFRIGVRLRGKNAELKAGEYAIPSRASMASVMGILIEGKSIEHKLTAAEGLTSRMIYELVRSNPVLIGNAGPAPAEGTLLPETYLFTRGTTRAQILTRMARAQSKLVAKLWPAREPGLPFKSPRDAIVLASIVEKETAIPEERRHIAAVFVNRLRDGMKLQSDPTIIYGITKGYPLGRGIRASEIAAPTPYNTYAIAGLPPTPICNPGKAAIEAVLRPEQSDDLYFVANGHGGHVFTSSIVQHEQNVARLRQMERANNHSAPTTDPAASGMPARQSPPFAKPAHEPKPHAKRHLRLHRRRS